jgi:hypothetical protein
MASVKLQAPDSVPSSQTVGRPDSSCGMEDTRPRGLSQALAEVKPVL